MRRENSGESSNHLSCSRGPDMEFGTFASQTRLTTDRINERTGCILGGCIWSLESLACTGRPVNDPSIPVLIIDNSFFTLYHAGPEVAAGVPSEPSIAFAACTPVACWLGWNCPGKPRTQFCLHHRARLPLPGEKSQNEDKYLPVPCTTSLVGGSG